MDEKRISYVALAVAGFSAVVAVGVLVSLNRAATKFNEEKTKRLELEQRVALLDKKTDDIQAATMNELAARLGDICTALKLDCGEAAEAEAPELPTVPDELLAKVGTPKETGDRIEVAVPGDITGAILTNIDVLKGEIGSLEPALRNTRPDGFRLAGFRAGGLGLRLGFRDGDVVRAVNGLPFTTEDEIVKVFESLEDGRAASITFDLRRDGREIQLVVQDPKRKPIIAPVP